MLGVLCDGFNQRVVCVVTGRGGQPAGLDLTLGVGDEVSGPRLGRSCFAERGPVFRSRSLLRCTGVCGCFRASTEEAFCRRAWSVAEALQAQPQQRGQHQAADDPGGAGYAPRPAGDGPQPGAWREAPRTARHGHLFDRLQHVVGVVETLERVLGQRPVHEALPVAQVRRQARDRIARVHHGHRQRVLCLVGQFAGQHLPGQHAHAVEVGTRIDFFAPSLLRGHVGGASHGQAGAGDAAAVAAAQGNAEVRQQRTAGIVKQDVFRLDVAVDHAAAVGIGQGREQAAQDLACTGLVATEIALSQVAVGQVGHGVIRQPVGGPADVEDADDVRMVQPANGADLVLEPAPAHFIGQRIRAHDLQRHLAAE